MVDKRIHYKAETIDVSYDPRKCIHAAECVKGLPQVFNPQKKQWVDVKAASADDIARVIEKCPTGALKYQRLDGGDEERMQQESSIIVVQDGPLYLRGKINIKDSDGSSLNGEPRAALCRCGQSKIKPFCDNTHKEINFNG